MTSRIFSINLDDLTFAKLGELQKKYPEMSRNGMIRHIIHVVHTLEDPRLQSAKERQRILFRAFLAEGSDDWKQGPAATMYDQWFERKGRKLAKLIEKNAHKIDVTGKWLNE